MKISEVRDVNVDITARQEIVDYSSQLPAIQACSNALWRCLEVAFQATSGALSLTTELLRSSFPAQGGL